MRAGGASATATCARAQMRSYSTSRRSGVSLFEVVEAARHVVRIENDRGGDDRPGERTAAGLVAAGDRPDATLERRAFAAERRPENLLVQRQARGLSGATHGRHVDHARWRSATWRARRSQVERSKARTDRQEAVLCPD